MRLSSLLIVFTCFATGALLSLVVASLSADLIEDTSKRTVERELTSSGLDWAEVHAEGLQVFLAGIAPSEAARFKAISTAGGIVDATRVIDNMQLKATADIAPPRFSIEILRNDAGISLIGLIPSASDRASIMRELRKIAGADNVTDLLETADYDTPAGWGPALRYALSALKELPRSKISVLAGEVRITAISDSPEERQSLETSLLRRTPAEVQVALDISAPRPVITPFTLRFVIDPDGARFDACSADTDKARTQILTAARSAGFSGSTECTLGLGVPTPRWAEAVEKSIAGLATLGGGSVTFSDADITLTATTATDQALFDRVVGELESTLPVAFVLHSTLPREQEAQDASTAAEFIATLSPEGHVQLRGRMSNEISRDTTQSYAQARFGSDAVYMATRLDDSLPPSWPFRIMAGLDALSLLHNGALVVTPEAVSVSGRTGDPDANARIAQILADKLSQTDHFSINVSYIIELDPIAALPTAQDCIAGLQAVQTDHKIAFEPGSGTLDESAGEIINAAALQITECPDIKVEIQGHTDSQGRESMNQALSQTRAQAVLSALQERRILTSGFVAKGYGESQPIADNETAEGREANRRIEFVLILPEAETGATDAAATETDSQPDSETTTETAADPQVDAPSETAPETDADSDTSADTEQSPEAAPAQPTPEPTTEQPTQDDTPSAETSTNDTN